MNEEINNQGQTVSQVEKKKFPVWGIILIVIGVIVVITIIALVAVTIVWSSVGSSMESSSSGIELANKCLRAGGRPIRCTYNVETRIAEIEASKNSLDIFEIMVLLEDSTGAVNTAKKNVQGVLSTSVNISVSSDAASVSPFKAKTAAIVVIDGESMVCDVSSLEVECEEI